MEMKLDHFTIRTPDPDMVKDFFGELLGLKPGFRPNFRFPGYWLYGSDPDQAILHLVGQKADQPTLEIGEDTGALDHIAFQGDDYDKMLKKLKDENYEFFEGGLPDGLAKQLFVTGPHKVLIEIVFPARP